MNVVDPSTGQPFAELQTDTPESVASKVRAARAAQPAWAARPFAERRSIIARFRDLLVERDAELAAIQSRETGKPITQALNELRATPARVDFFLENAEAVMRPRAVLSGPTEEEVRYEPLGVVANVSAWNYPWFVGSNVYVPALLTGCAVLYKPSELASLTGLSMARLLVEAGVPGDVFAPIVGDGAIGAALLAHPVDGVFFTGSHATGLAVARAAAMHLAHVQLELGGKDPAYVAEDFEAVPAAEALADGAFYNNGQSCCAVERIYVHERIYDAFVEAFVATVRGFRMGEPADEGTYLGPLTREAQLAVLRAQVEDAVARGARVLTGGRRADRPGWYFEPTVVVDVNHDMALMRDESFGPIIGIQRVSGDDEALRLMNDTPYGLTAAVYTRDRARAERLLSAVRTGTAYWNCCDRVSPRLPWTGRGHSGVGSTLSLEGIRAFLVARGWHLRT